jgi:CcmD family protein
MPDLATSVKYVAAAYLVVWLAILVYVWLIGQKVGRIEAELDRLERELEARAPASASSPAPPTPDTKAIA